MSFINEIEKANLQGEILWLEALADSIDDGKTEEALEAIEHAVTLKRKQIKELNDV